MSTTNDGGLHKFPGTRLQLKIWHPNCWTLQVTEATEAKLIADGVYTTDEKMKAHFVAYADTSSQIDELIDAIRASPLTETVAVMKKQYDIRPQKSLPGNTTRELFVVYEQTNSIHDALISRGFIPEEPIRIKEGHEYWTVALDGKRTNMNQRLDEIRTEMNASIEIRQIETATGNQGTGDQFSYLSERQREVFQLARREGYYTWPREVSATDLAEKINVSQATVLEHLRKAETKILGPDNK